MACNITLNGITKGCNDNIGGIKTVYFLPFDNLYPAFAPDMVTGKVIGLSYYGDFAKYEFNKQTAQFTTTPQVNEIMDTIVYSTDLVMKFNKLEATKHQEIYNLCKSEVVALVVDNNGESWILGGYQSGIVSGGTMTSGVNYADGSGYEITVNFLEITRVLNPLLNVNFSTFKLGDIIPGIRGLVSNGTSIVNNCLYDNGNLVGTSIKVVYGDNYYEVLAPTEGTSVSVTGEVIFLFDLTPVGSLRVVSLNGGLSGYITIDDKPELYDNLKDYDFSGNNFSTAQKNRIVDEVNRVSGHLTGGSLSLDGTPSLDTNSIAFKNLSEKAWTITY